MRMKRTMALALTLALLPLAALAENIFPQPDRLFGVTMPYIANAVGREADSVEETDDRVTYSYAPFTIADYDALDAYLAAAGLSLRSQSVQENVLTAELARDGAVITLRYSYAGRTASLTYPAGTRLEKEALRLSGQKSSILPDIRRIFGAAIPDLSAQLPLHPAARKLQENGTDMVRYTEVSIPDYGEINSHLTALGCAAMEWHADDGVLYASMSYGGGVFTIRYELEAQRFTIICPELYYLESAKAATLDDGVDLVLPAPMEAMGAILPRISTALLRRPDRTETAGDGYTETYESFTEADYALFSAYLVDKSVQVDGYGVSETGVLEISLSVQGVAFSFHYDQVHQRATAIYPTDARLEPEFAAAAAATPTPTPVGTPAPTARPTATPRPTAAPRNYDQAACWGIAEAYFMNLSWRNPSTVTIWSHWFTTGENGYTFYIDYSAMNGFGGYNRETYVITVNWSTGRVTSAWSY